MHLKPTLNGLSKTPSAPAEDCSSPVRVGDGIVYVLTVVPIVLVVIEYVTIFTTSAVTLGYLSLAC